MWTQGAVSPRSASPVGPAPTRLPRIALPVATMSLLEVQISPMHFSGGRYGPGAGLVGEAHDEIKTNDGGAPHQPQGNGEPVEVTLGDRGTTHGAGHASTEHVGQTTALALMQQNQQGQNQTRHHEQHLQPDFHGIHVSQTQSHSASVRSHQRGPRHRVPDGPRVSTAPRGQSLAVLYTCRAESPETALRSTAQRALSRL